MKNFLFACVILLNTTIVYAKSFELNNRQQIIDFTQGATFFGSGGGGDPVFGQQMLLDALAAGKAIKIVDSNSLKKQAWVITPYLMGSSGNETEQDKLAKQKLGLTNVTVNNMPSQAAKNLIKIQNHAVAAVVPLEVGGASSSSSISSAAWLGVPVIDGSYLDRAMPEVSQAEVAHNTNTYEPLTSVDAFGNEITVTHAINVEMAEHIGKALASASYGLVGQATFLMPLTKAQPYIVTNTMSDAYELGKAIREANENGDDPLKIITKLTGATQVFAGKVESFNAKTIGGYYKGDVTISNDQNQTAKISFSNENMKLTIEDKNIATAPDLIAVVKQETGQAIRNSAFENGEAVAVFFRKA